MMDVNVAVASALRSTKQARLLSANPPNARHLQLCELDSGSVQSPDRSLAQTQHRVSLEPSLGRPLTTNEDWSEAQLTFKAKLRATNYSLFGSPVNDSDYEDEFLPARVPLETQPRACQQQTITSPLTNANNGSNARLPVEIQPRVSHRQSSNNVSQASLPVQTQPRVSHRQTSNNTSQARLPAETQPRVSCRHTSNNASQTQLPVETWPRISYQHTSNNASQARLPAEIQPKLKVQKLFVSPLTNSNDKLAAALRTEVLKNQKGCKDYWGHPDRNRTSGFKRPGRKWQLKQKENSGVPQLGVDISNTSNANRERQLREAREQRERTRWQDEEQLGVDISNTTNANRERERKEAREQRERTRRQAEEEEGEVWMKWLQEFEVADTLRMKTASLYSELHEFD